MSRLRKLWKLGLALVLFVLVAQVGVSLVLRTQRVRGYLIARLESTFGRRVEVRVFSASLLPTPSVDAEGISVGEDPAFGDEYFLRADRLTARLRLLGLLRGRFEFGTLTLDRPSLILVKNAEGRWNLERWLPPAASSNGMEAARSYGPSVSAAVANRLQKIEVTDGRVNFKLGNEKKSFAFTTVNGNVEQIAAGRWQLNLEAQPWRSGVQLQSTGTIRVRGDVAGTSARLRPAHLQVRWSGGSLADLVRLIRGQDEGVRGLFDLEATAESGTKESKPDVTPGEWSFLLSARASQIHRWDLTERQDNPKLSFLAKGTWLPANGSVNLGEVLVEGPKSNLRGTASLASVPGTHFVFRVDSAGVQSSDLLAWYRAFQPGVVEGVTADPYFTGGLTVSGWPLTLEGAAFSSTGGKISVPGFRTPVRVGPVRGGMEKRKFVVDPWELALPPEQNPKGTTPKKAAEAQTGRNAAAAESSVSIGFAHNFETGEGNLSIEGRANKAEAVLKLAGAAGRQLNHGWEWTGQTVVSLRRDWGNEKAAGWNGQIGFSGGELQIAGLNQAVKIEEGALRWQNSKRTVAVGSAQAFGAAWAGEIAERTPGSSETDFPWRFNLHADHLDAADLDRWVGPRARPGWLERLLPALLGNGAQTTSASELLRRISAEGEVRIDEFDLEKIKLKKVRAQATLHDLHLGLNDCEAQWASGTLRGVVNADFTDKPVYELRVSAEKVNLALVPLAGRVADRLSGTASGELRLKTEGIGREVLLDKLRGEGKIQLKNAEYRGWDARASLSGGTPRAGVTRWTEGDGIFHISERSLEVNALRLRGPQDELTLKGSISFGREADLTLETASTPGRGRVAGPGRVIQISGPLEGPKVSIQNLSVQQPGD